MKVQADLGVVKAASSFTDGCLLTAFPHCRGWGAISGVFFLRHTSQNKGSALLTWASQRPHLLTPSLGLRFQHMILGERGIETFGL